MYQALLFPESSEISHFTSLKLRIKTIAQIQVSINSLTASSLRESRELLNCVLKEENIDRFIGIIS